MADEIADVAANHMKVTTRSFISTQTVLIQEVEHCFVESIGIVDV